MARRVRRRFRGGRIVDLACGHGLTAQLLLLLDRTSPAAFAVDGRIPASAASVFNALAEQWPEPAARVSFEPMSLATFPLTPADLVVSVHACGALTDVVLERAMEVRARVAVLPCCHDATVSDTSGLTGWMDDALAIDCARVARLRGAGYDVFTQRIPASITPKNRLLLAEPRKHR